MEGLLRNYNFEYAIVSGGCSYTLPLEYTQSQLKDEFFSKTLIHHIGLTSSSISYTKNSIIEFVNYLLKSGTPAEKIYVVANLTQLGRRNYKFNKHESKSIINTLNNNEELEWYNFSVNDFTYEKYSHGFSNLNNTIYSSIAFGDELYNMFPNDIKNNIKSFITFKNSHDFEDLVLDYFNDLIILQTYLKTYNINYTMFFMSNIIEGWKDNFIQHRYSDSWGYFKVPDLKKDNFIFEINDLVNSFFKMIDFKNIVLYSTDKQKYGGIDEYAIDNFEPWDLATYRNLKEKKEFYGNEAMFFGQHPLSNVQMSFEKEFILPRISDKLTLFK